MHCTLPLNASLIVHVAALESSRDPSGCGTRLGGSSVSDRVIFCGVVSRLSSAAVAPPFESAPDHCKPTNQTPGSQVLSSRRQRDCNLDGTGQKTCDCIDRQIEFCHEVHLDLPPYDRRAGCFRGRCACLPASTSRYAGRLAPANDDLKFKPSSVLSLSW